MRMPTHEPKYIKSLLYEEFTFTGNQKEKI